MSAAITSCKECGSTDLSWQTHNRVDNGVQQNRLNTNDVTCVFVLGCNACSETLAVMNADKVAASMNAALGATPSVKPDIDAESLIPPGWTFSSADFSMQAAGKQGDGWAMLTRNEAGRKEWFALPDGSEARKAYPLNATGKGVTLREAVAAAVATITGRPA
jgi:hypothetical protein